MVRDSVNQDTYRADHLLEDFLEKKINDTKTKLEDRLIYEEVLRQIPNFQTEKDFDEVIKRFEIKSP